MSDRVHPRDNDDPLPLLSDENRKQVSSHGGSQSSYSTTLSSGTFLITIPKDLIHRYPPPENAYKTKQFKNRRILRRTCRQCCGATLCLLLIIISLLASAAAIFYLIYHPKPPSFSVDSFSIQGLNVTAAATSTTISPALNVTIRTENPNGVIGIYYEPGSDIAVFHDNMRLCGGALPAFYQAPRNVTVLSTVLLGGDIVVSGEVRQKLAEEQRSGSVPLRMALGLPVKVRVGFVRSWKVTVKVVCDVAVTTLLTAEAGVVTKECSVDFRPW